MKLSLVIAGVVATVLVVTSLAAATRSGVGSRIAVSLTPRTALAGGDVRASFRGTTLKHGTTLRSVTIKWGDGTRPVVLHKLTASPTHRYRYPGHYTVRVSVTDGKGVSGVVSIAERVVRQALYWDLFNGTSSDYQLQFTKLPLTAKSTDASVSGTAENGLDCTSGMDVDSKGRLFVISYPSGCSAPSPAEIQVFRLPFTASSKPVFTLALPGTGGVDNLTFDRKGNLWAEDRYRQKVYEFPAPFTDNTTLAPSLTLSLPDMTPSGLAFDPKGDLFVSNVSGTPARAIAMYDVPITADSVPTFLKGLDAPGGLTFDKLGNLYASNNPSDGKGAAIVRYNGPRFKPGATPSVVDTAGLEGIPYEANFAWDASGNLYVADCGTVANVRVYPLATKPFTSKRSPSVTHRDAAFDQDECAWGVAVG